MLAVASSLFARSAIYQSYTINALPPSSPAPSGSSLPSAKIIPPFQVGLWRVQTAFHKTTGKRISVWTCDKKSSEMDKLSLPNRDRVIDFLKREAQALRKMRHPCILEMVEPLEETRSELIFATEPLLSSLAASIKTSPKDITPVDLDEIEIQKGVLQLCKALAFLHDSVKLIHSNLNPSTVLINSAGDWKLGSLALTIPLVNPDGSPSRWEFPQWDSRLPIYVQRSFDFMAPEFAIDEQLNPSSDMYSLGCLLYAVHVRGLPPFRNHGSLQNLRQNVGNALSGTERLDPDLQRLLTALISRTPHGRPTPSSLPSMPFFSSLPVSTLNFLERTTFAAKPREEKIAFMKGLTSVLGRFSDGLKERKLLPSLLEEMKDVNLIPSILPNVFAISKTLSSHNFASLVLPGLKPLFALKEPPQNMLTLLENLPLLQEKSDKAVFKDHILPLVYNALDSEHPTVQERALKTIPTLCDTIDYAEVQWVIFPKVAIVFTKTRILSVKIQTLECFLAMVKTLDQASLTRKLVPLLSKIRTRVSKPAVMLATLNVQEAMGLKVDREAVATLVLPQLWTLSMGPMLTLGQFSRFMAVIRKLSERVENEHSQFLRDHQRLDDRSSIQTNGSALTPDLSSNTLTFESLVHSNPGPSQSGDTSSWDEDVWGSILGPSNEETWQRRNDTPAPSNVSRSVGLPNSSAYGNRTITTGRPDSELRIISHSPHSQPSFAPLSAKPLTTNPGQYGDATARPSLHSGVMTIGGIPLHAAASSPKPFIPAFDSVLVPTKTPTPVANSRQNNDWARDFDPLG